MEENSFKNKKDLQGRTFNFAVEIIKLLKEVKYSKENDVIKYQLAKSATSVGANYSPC
jgi:four helix bundle protein